MDFGALLFAYGFAIFIVAAGYGIWLFSPNRITPKNIDRELTPILLTHRDTLARKLRAGIYLDDYGNVVSKTWERELAYFIDTVVIPQLIKVFGASLNREYLYDQVNRYVANHVQETTTDVGFSTDMTGEEYERMCGYLLEQAGWSVAGTAATGDQGVDLVAEKDERRVAIQCKRYQRPVNNKAIQEIAAGARLYECGEAVVVSNADFNGAARQLASANGVRLVHHEELVGL